MVKIRSIKTLLEFILTSDEFKDYLLPLYSAKNLTRIYQNKADNCLIFINPTLKIILINEQKFLSKA